MTTTLDNVTIRLDAAHDLRAAGLPAGEADALAKCYREAAAAICEGTADVRVQEVIGGADIGCDAAWAKEFGLWQFAHDCCRRIDGLWTVDVAEVERTRRSLSAWVARQPPTVAVLVGHRSGIAGARWCRPVGWSPRNRIEGAEWSDEAGAWNSEYEEEAGIVVFGHDNEGDTVTVGLDDLRVASSGECRVIGEVEVDFA